MRLLLACLVVYVVVAALSAAVIVTAVWLNSKNLSPRPRAGGEGVERGRRV